MIVNSPEIIFRIISGYLLVFLSKENVPMLRQDLTMKQLVLLWILFVSFHIHFLLELKLWLDQNPLQNWDNDEYIELLCIWIALYWIDNHSKTKLCLFYYVRFGWKKWTHINTLNYFVLFWYWIDIEWCGKQMNTLDYFDMNNPFIRKRIWYNGIYIDKFKSD